MELWYRRKLISKFVDKIPCQNGIEFDDRFLHLFIIETGEHPNPNAVSKNNSSIVTAAPVAMAITIQVFLVIIQSIM